MKKVYLVLTVLCILLLDENVLGQVTMTTTGNYTQDFNTLISTGSGTWTDNTTIANWYAQRTGTGTTIAADAGAGTGGNLYSYGSAAAADRALGSLGSGNAAAGSFAWGLLLRNTSGTTITDIKITYTGEQWRNSAAAAQVISFYYKTSASTITALNPNVNATWTAVAALNFTSPITGGVAGALDGNLAANRTTISNIAIPSLSLANNDYIMIKWDDPDHAGTDHGLSIDDVTVSWTVTPLGTPTINVNPTSLTGFLSTSGVPSATQSYTVDGSNLTADITITPPTGYEISTTNAPFTPASPITLTQSGGTVSTTTIYARLNSTTLGVNSGNITNTSTGANNPNVSVTGKVLDAEPTTQGSITIGTVTNNSIQLTLTAGNGAKQLLAIHALTPVANDPVDGTTYTPSTVFGSGSNLGANTYVVFNGTSGNGGAPITVTGLAVSTTYHFAVYEFNDGGGISGAENYLVTTPGIADATTINLVNTYIWSGANGSLWTDPLNWLPVRTTPATNDSLLFIGPLTVTVTGVPTETIGYMGVSLGANVTLQASANNNTLTISGGFAGEELEVEAASQLNISGNNALTINIPSGNTSIIDGDMTFSAGVATAHKFTAGAANGITFNTGSSFTSGTFMSGNPFGAATANSVVFVSGSVFRQIAGSNPFALPQPASVVVFQTGSLYKLMAGLTPSVSGRTYADFEFDAPSTTVTATGGSLLTMDNLTVTSGTLALGMTGAGWNLKGNVLVAPGASLSISQLGVGLLNLSGTTPQTITNNGSFLLGNSSLTINNPAGVTSNSDLEISGVGATTFTLTSGILKFVAPATTLSLSATTTLAGTPSNTAFVDGKVKKVGNSNFTFPVGKTGFGYVPIGISNFVGGASNDTLIAEYKRGNARLLGPVTDPFIDHVSGCDWWTLDLIHGTPTVDVTAYWSTSNVCNGTTYIDDLAQLELVHFDGTNWNSSSVGFSSISGTSTTTAGDITWTGVNTFSPFALGSKTTANPLPININYFTGVKQSSNHILNWKVTCTNTPTANMQIERSTDGGRTYSTVHTVNATALQCQQPFSFTDGNPAKGVNYYRLKLTDAFGKVSYSSIVSLINATKGFDILNINPNPVNTGRFNLKVSAAQSAKIDLVITDMQGRVLQQQTASLVSGFNEIPVSVSKLAPGTYQVAAYTAEGRTAVLRFVVQ